MDQPLLTTTAYRTTAVLTTLAAVLTGLMCGVFLAFSTSVMKALGKLPAPQGIMAMQNMNVAIVNPLFLVVLAGSTLACLGLLVTAPFLGVGHTALWVLGSLLFLVGAIGVTAAVDVPMNNALAAVDPTSAEGAATWQTYLVRWTRFNDLRAASSVAATALLIAAAWLSGR